LDRFRLFLRELLSDCGEGFLADVVLDPAGVPRGDLRGYAELCKERRERFVAAVSVISPSLSMVT
jgi:hypothetical protein